MTPSALAAPELRGNAGFCLVHQFVVNLNRKKNTKKGCGIEYVGMPHGGLVPLASDVRGAAY